MHLEKCIFVHDRRDRPIQPDGVLCLQPRFAVAAPFHRVHIDTRILLVAQDLIDLRILDGAAVAAPDACLPHLPDQLGESPAIQGGVEHLAHIECLEIVDDQPQLLYTQLGEDKIALLKQYKQDLLSIRRDTFREATDCLLELYVLTVLLDKAIRNTEKTDVSLILSAVRCVANDGKSLIEHHAKEHYLDRIIANGRSSHKDSEQIEDKIEAFRKAYDRFQSEVLSIANEFNIMTARVPPHEISEFITV